MEGGHKISTPVNRGVTNLHTRLWQGGGGSPSVTGKFCPIFLDPPVVKKFMSLKSVISVQDLLSDNDCSSLLYHNGARQWVGGILVNWITCWSNLSWLTIVKKGTHHLFYMAIPSYTIESVTLCSPINCLRNKSKRPTVHAGNLVQVNSYYPIHCQ